ncbi:MAG: exonuclease SbcCD subunit D, partial [Thermoplasmata archaeon]
MRIIHFADTHLGFSAYRRVDHDGVNKREKDVYDAFSRMIDYIIETRPDIVIHAGDLFDNVRPTNRAIGVALNQLSRLSKEEIPTVVISGNHETPKLKETGHIFKTFEHLDYVFPVYGDKEEIIKLNIRGYTVKIHAVPHCRSKEDFLNALERVEPDERSD